MKRIFSSYRATLSAFTAVLMLTFLFSCNSPQTEEQSVPEKPKDELALLNDQIAKEPTNHALLYKRAEYFLVREQIRQAFDDINKALSVDSTKDEYYVLLANINFKAFHMQNAVEAFNKAIALNPQNVEAHIKLAELQLYLKDYAKCLEAANLALKLDKNNAKGYFIKGFAFKETGDTGKAISSFQTATEVKPDYYDAYIQLGNIFTVRNHPLALQYYNNALKIRPTSTEALYNRGLFFQNNNDTANARNDYNTILRIDSRYADAYYNLGYIEMAYSKNYKAAIKYFTDAIRLNEEYLEAFYNRGLAFELSGDKESAIKDYKHAISIMPTYKLAKNRLKSLGK